MNTRVEKATALRAQGFNCAQAVIAALADELGISEETALGFAGGFGGGMRAGEMCGAVSGAVMAIGLRYGQVYPDDAAAKGQCGLVTGQFVSEFERRMGALRCNDLLGYDTRDAAAKAKFGDRNKTVCPKAIETALLLLEEMGF